MQNAYPWGSQPTNMVSLLNYLNTETKPDPNPPPPIGKNTKSILSTLVSSRISIATVP